MAQTNSALGKPDSGPIAAKHQILPDFEADPSARVFHGRLYVYPSHDVAGSKDWDMIDWHVFSTVDMLHWKDHGVIFSLKDIRWADKHAWAPDCIERNGKYYFYFPADDKIGVAVSDSPTGPFKDALGKPLVDSMEAGADVRSIDPTVFIDDDGQAYLYFGNSHDHVAVVKLKQDMITRDGPIQVLDLKNYHEGIWVHKRNGLYYFSYPSYRGDMVANLMEYSVATNPLGPFQYKGVILDNRSRNIHGSITEFKGRWWLFYHVAGPSPYERRVCVAPLHYDKDGSILPVPEFELCRNPSPTADRGSRRSQGHVSAEPAAQSTTNTTIDNEGTVHAPPFEIPLSSYMSREAKLAFIKDQQKAADPADQAVWKSGSLLDIRKLVDIQMTPRVERAKAVFAVNIVEQEIGGVRTRVITPKNGVAARNRDRVLIDLHGGCFFLGAEGGALAEAIPIAGTARIKVITVDYREGPEYKFPAASEDVAAVYKALLEHYKPKSIGIYGCSAGGILTAMAAAWFQEKNLPTPGALALWSSGAFANWDGNPQSVGSWGGDSAYLGPVLEGGAPLTVDSDPTLRVSKYQAYLSNADLRSPLVSPAEWPAVLAKFPSTLLMTGTRGWDMSAAVETHRRLVKAGVEADLHLWDGVGHCFFSDVDLPESKEAYDMTSRFFDRHLASPSSR